VATDHSYVEYICDQVALPDALAYKKMFGEYALYLDEKIVALVCDNMLFLKPTAEGREILGVVSEQPPYPGAKLHFRIDGEIDDRELLQRLFVVTASALPVPKPSRTKAKRRFT
jgi:TfoX/Sxy family transcriptional regulator of competence genes